MPELAAATPSPVPGSPASPGSAPPTGASPATGPTPNRGYEMAGLQRLGIVLKQLESLVPLLGSQSESGRDVLKSINMLSKHVQPGTVTPASEKNNLNEMMMRLQQGMGQQQQMRQQMPQQQQRPMAPPAAAAA